MLTGSYRDDGWQLVEVEVSQSVGVKMLDEYECKYMGQIRFAFIPHIWAGVFIDLLSLSIDQPMRMRCLSHT